MRRLFLVACAAAAMLAIAAGPAQTAERRPLPPLALADLTGVPLEGPGLPDTGTWLLVLVRPACPACDTLLDRMNGDERPEARRITIVVNGPADAAEAIKAKYPNLTAARWRLDANGSAVQVLRAPTAPAVWGVRNQTIEWELAGPLRGGAELESVLFSWVGRK
jgi:hypothetical protein